MGPNFLRNSDKVPVLRPNLPGLESLGPRHTHHQRSHQPHDQKLQDILQGESPAQVTHFH